MLLNTSTLEFVSSVIRVDYNKGSYEESIHGKNEIKNMYGECCKYTIAIFQRSKYKIMNIKTHRKSLTD